LFPDIVDRALEEQRELRGSLDDLAVFAVHGRIAGRDARRV
jgi:hypothetical protein